MRTVFGRPHAGPGHLGFVSKPFVVGSRKRPAAPPKHRLVKYLAKEGLTVTPPASVNYGPKAAAALSLIYMNDRLGDCVIAGGGHVEGVLTGNATGAPLIMSDDQILAQYEPISGYNPSDPSTDQGCDEITAFQYWKKNGFPNGTDLLGWVGVDATNPTEIKQALFLFENLFFGIELPDGWLSPIPESPGFTWGVAGDPNPRNGHCIMGYAYDENGIYFDTWGLVSPDGLQGGFMPYEAVAKYAVPSAGGELYTLMSPDQVASGQNKAPNGVGWIDLLEDMSNLGGNVEASKETP